MIYNNLVEINSRSDSPNTTTDSTASSTKSETSIRLGKGIWLSKTYRNLRFTGIMSDFGFKNAINIRQTIFEARNRIRTFDGSSEYARDSRTASGYTLQKGLKSTWVQF